ncbi:hypothetical protein RchiOBHm_Chr4g0396711 [Rosa chinensis]|uniref:Uncharacterized protein n=1 Tax=Rosa chinensis TaxID=74649 RepID=A0A2P6QRX4_ROSCH|nr:hypothetical protein RchiOBHm_Chr4g0396711 [Rosa chinensis]
MRGSQISWRELVRVSMVEEILGSGVEGLMIRDQGCKFQWSRTRRLVVDEDEGTCLFRERRRHEKEIVLDGILSGRLGVGKK